MLKTRIVVIVLSVHCALLTYGAVQHSPVVLEVAHLPAGLSHIQTGHFDLYRVNPPLVRLVAALPVCFASPVMGSRKSDSDTIRRSHTSVGVEFLRANGGRSFWLYFLARWACIPFSLLGGYVCFRWARDLYGETSGILALALWCFSPNVIAHAELITPDASATAMGVTAAYLFWRWLKSPSWSRAFGVGIVLGLTELTKMTWTVLFILWPMLWLVWNLPARRQMAVLAWRRQVVQLSVILLLGVYVLNLGYGFEDSFRPLGNYRFASGALSGVGDVSLERNDEGGNRFAGTLWGSLPVPLPANYVQGIDLQKSDFERKMWSYLGGEWREGGWWYYYIYALGIKVPLGTLGLVVLAVLWSLFCRRYSGSWRDEVILLAPLIVILVFVSSQTGFNHHLRYVLPIFPFAFVWMSKLARSVKIKHRKTAVITGALLLHSVGSSLSVYPHNLSYFNELAGGPMGGHAYLGGSIYDSNVDWGQDLLFLKRWLDAHPEAQPIGIAFNNIYEPSAAGIEYSQPPHGPASQDSVSTNPDILGPQPGWYAMSVNKIRSRTKEYAYFLNFEPVAMAGYSIYIYDITMDEANRVRRELGLPDLPNDQNGNLE